MIDIENLSEYIEDEIKDAGKYARCALKHKDETPALAELFFRLSGEESEHARMLYDEAMKEVKSLREKYTMDE
jgi:rubrerythrin